MPFLKKSFPDDLRMYRKHHGLTQTELARQLNFSAETISAWERGKRTPHIQQIPLLARLLDMDVKELLGSIDTNLDRGQSGQFFERVPDERGNHLMTAFPSQKVCEEYIREAARAARKVKILTIRGEKYFMGSRSLLHNLCSAKRSLTDYVRVLVLSPDSAHVSEELAGRIDHESAEEIRDKMQLSLNNLKFHAQRNPNFVVKCYMESPNFKILRFDDIMFVSSFAGGGPKNDHSASMFQLVREGNSLFAGFNRYFDDMWERAAFPE